MIRTLLYDLGGDANGTVLLPPRSNHLPPVVLLLCPRRDRDRDRGGNGETDREIDGGRRRD